VRDLLEEVKRLGYLYVETRADLDQVRFRDDLTFLDVMRR
jgi:alkaline phosphatase